MVFNKDKRKNHQKLLEAYKQGKIDLDYIYKSIDIFITPTKYRMLLFDIKRYEDKMKKLTGESPLFKNIRKEEE